MKLGFPDQLRAALLAEPTQLLRRQLSEASLEVVTGRKTNLSESLGARAGEYSLVTKAINDLDGFVERMTLGQSRLSAMTIPITSMQKTISGFAEEAEFALGTDGYVSSAVQETAMQQVGAAISSLGASYAGRSLFGGDEVNASPIASEEEFFASFETAISGATDEASLDAAITAYFADGGTFDTDIYQGGTDEAAAIRLPDGGRIRYTVMANDPAFKSTLEGLVRIAYAPDDASSSFLNGATSILRQGQDSLVGLEAALGLQQNRLDTALENAQQEKAVLQETENDYAGVDEYEAVTRLTNLQTQLEAAYTVTSRLSRLNLTNFI